MTKPEAPRQVDLKIVAPHLDINATREAGVAAWLKEQAGQLSGADKNHYLTLAAQHEASAAEAQRNGQVGVAAIGSAFAQTDIKITRQGPTTVVRPSFSAASLPGDQRGTLGMTRVGRQVDSQLITRVAIEVAKDKAGNLPASADKYFRGYNGPTLGDMVKRAAYVFIHLGETPEETHAEHNTKILGTANRLRDQLQERARQVRLQSVQNTAPISLSDYGQLSATPSNPLDAIQEAADYAAVTAGAHASSWREGGTHYTQITYDNPPSLDQILHSSHDS